MDPPTHHRPRTPAGPPHRTRHSVRICDPRLATGAFRGLYWSPSRRSFPRAQAWRLAEEHIYKLWRSRRGVCPLGLREGEAARRLHRSIAMQFYELQRDAPYSVRFSWGPSSSNRAGPIRHLGAAGYPKQGRPHALGPPRAYPPMQRSLGAMPWALSFLHRLLGRARIFPQAERYSTNSLIILGAAGGRGGGGGWAGGPLL